MSKFFITLAIVALFFLSSLLWLALADRLKSAWAGPLDNLRRAASLLQELAMVMGLLVMLLAMAFLTVSILQSVVSKIEHRNAPRPVIFFAMLKMSEVASDAAKFEDDEVRRYCVNRLENAARCLEKGLAWQLRLASPSFNSVVQHRMRSAAEAVRERQVWLTLPEPQTGQDLLRFSLDVMSAVATGRYGELPLASSEITTKVKFVNALMGTGRIVLGAIVPVSLVVALDATNVLRGGATSVALYAVASILAIISIMTLIDPGFTSRIATAKDVVGMFKEAGGFK
ncbi:hypothetical protein [Actinoplanes friuliensis]|uniref:hypothetical protein n=1 Tax=Actinoplanes friuliensis TaxID=196914 RepID=UPI0011DC991B|nr:hypothetical protein [Actinoplanes friuliensis]